MPGSYTPDISMQRTPVEQLLVVLATVQEHAPPDAAAWLDQGVAKFMSGGITLDTCLDLTVATGKRSAVAQYKTRQRLLYLREALEHIEPDRKPWPRAGLLAVEIDRFQRIQWPCWCDLQEPPHGISELRAALFSARRHGPLPQGQRGVSDFLKSQD